MEVKNPLFLEDGPINGVSLQPSISGEGPAIGVVYLEKAVQPQAHNNSKKSVRNIYNIFTAKHIVRCANFSSPRRYRENKPKPLTSVADAAHIDIPFLAQYPVPNISD